MQAIWGQLHIIPIRYLHRARHDVRISEWKAKGPPHACQAVPEAVADADPRVLEDPQPRRRGGADADPELELMRDLEWTLTGERELGRREEGVVKKGDTD